MSFSRSALAAAFALVTATSLISAAPASAGGFGGILLPTLTFPSDDTTAPAPLIPSTKG